MSPARARTRTVCSGVERTNHEATAPPVLTIRNVLFPIFVTATSHVKFDQMNFGETCCGDKTSGTKNEDNDHLAHMRRLFFHFWVAVCLFRRTSARARRVRCTWKWLDFHENKRHRWHAFSYEYFRANTYFNVSWKSEAKGNLQLAYSSMSWLMPGACDFHETLRYVRESNPLIGKIRLTEV